MAKSRSELSKKVLGGELLSPDERAMLELDAAPIEPAPSKTLAKNKAELADVLGVNRKTIQRYSKATGAPKPRTNGALDVAAWREFLSRNNVIDSEDLDTAALKAKQILLQNRILQQKIDMNDAAVYPADDVEKDTAALVGAAKTVLLQGPSTLAPQVVGVSVQEAERLLREWIFNALSKLQREPLGTREE